MIKGVGIPPLFTALSTRQTVVSDMAFRGNLLDRPCHMSGDSLNKHVIFKTRVSRGFWYPPGRSPTEPLVIRLENYHIAAVGKIVALTFKGTGRAAFPDHLKVAEVDTSRLDIALLDTDDSNLLKPGVSHNKGQGGRVIGNSLELPFGIYVVATPEALRTKSVVPGGYEAVAMFELTYHQQNFCAGYFR